MKIIEGNIFDLSLEPDAICFTSSHTVEGNQVVMHSPSAKVVHKHMPNIASELADKLLPDIWVQCIPVALIKGIELVSLQTKPSKLTYLSEESDMFVHGKPPKVGDMYPGYLGKSYNYMCSLSAKKLKKLTDSKGWKKVIVAAPDDCDLQQVLSHMRPHLDDRFIIVKEPS